MASFMSLPPEIRTEIYDLCLFPQHDYVAIHYCTKPRDLVSTTFKSPIFRLSAQIRTEALIRLFKTKAFEFSDLASMLRLLNWAGDYADMIKEVKIYVFKEITDETVVEQLRERLATMKGLKTITLLRSKTPNGMPSTIWYNMMRTVRVTEKAETQGVRINSVRVGQ
ncbi:hypothetical protein DM02DRAFT_217764 [Periconia macrospinosa]|uniref:2EXR domain-containing protein n=1 Tax=Periconia macrospinosa TaxID=97972 RepID=A0A2V1E2V6_9PLEO|nr:hypothetical protein DM02DRAFT_217764 [Periconia macrospinosa]